MKGGSMTHIVTGGAGMIGSHLVDALAERGEKVRVVDNFMRGSMENLRGSMRSGMAEISHLNLENTGIPMLSDDVVWHLAAKVTGIEYNRHNQYDMLQSNLAINYNVIRSVRKGKPKLFVYVSTACVYPHDAPVPTPESAGDIGDPEPTNHGYGVAKWLGEQMVKHLTIEHNVPCVIVRFFNSFGERDYYDEATSHVAPALIRRVMEGENPVTVWGSGNQTRALVDVKDIVTALLRLHDRMLTDETMYAGKYPGGPFVVNIGHEKEVSIRELAETIVRLCDKDVGLVFDTSKPDGYPRRAADTTFLHQLIGWVPDTPLEETLAAMVQEFREGRSHT
jgi:nucleoside-diphosphate-sugar epimerase